MKKIRYAVILLLPVLMLFCVACDEKEEQENTESVSEISEEESMEDSEVVYVTAEEYREFYGLSEDFVPPEYLEEYLNTYPITYEELKWGKDYMIVTDFYNEGHVFGCNINELINGKKMYATEEDDFSDVTHIIIKTYQLVAGTENEYISYTYVIDRERNMYYRHSGNGAEYDYTKSDNAYEIDDETVDMLLGELKGIIKPEWIRAEYIDSYKVTEWKLFLVKEDETVIAYTGYDPDEEGHPGFSEWLDKIQEYKGQ